MDASDVVDPSLALKSARVHDACRAHDTAALIRLATSPQGLLDDQARQIAWPILLGIHHDTQDSAAQTWQRLPPHRDEQQVRLDVDRSFVYYPKGETEKQLDRRKDDLRDLIVQTLRSFPFLCYFQGYHDIVQVLLLVLGRDLAAEAVARVSLLRLRDFMLPSLSASVAHLRLLPHILRTADPALERHLASTQPYFALAATLTLYAHDIEEYGDIARLFDFFLASEASMPIYLFATIILSRKKELLEVEADEPEMLHSILSKLPKPLDLDKLIARTVHLFEQHPPTSLPGRPWRGIYRYSVLKTTQDAQALSQQSLNDGRSYFEKQALDLSRKQMLYNMQLAIWKYRRPTGSVGLAILVGVLSWYLRKDGTTTTLHAIWQYIRAIV